MPSLNRFYLIPAFLLAFTVAAVAEPIVLWPMPQPPAGTPVDAFPLPHVGSLYRLQQNIFEARRHPVDLIFDGDSVTDFWRNGGNTVWQQRYGALNAVNFAISWDLVQNCIWRLEHGQLDGLHPKLAVLLFGSDNTPANSASDVAAGITAAVADYRKSCPDTHILLLGILPRSARPADLIRARITQVNQLISKLDDGAHVTFMDIGPKFLQPDGTISKELMADFVHPTAKGYQIWADAIQPVIDQYCPKSAVSAARTAAGPAVSTNTEAVTWPLPTPPPGTVVTTFPVPRVDPLERFLQNCAKLKDGPNDLVFDGDSITDNWQRSGHDVWAQRYGAIKAIDIGIGGDQTQHVLWRVQHGDLEGQNPKLIVLMIGTNNGGRNPADICAGIKLILNEYESRCSNAHILLLGVFPRDHVAKSPSRDWIKKINRILATYDDGKRVTFMDIGAKFLDPDGTLSAEIMPDFLHPSAKGYVILADAIQPMIDQYFPKTAAAR